jgi:hypothetical protein
VVCSQKKTREVFHAEIFLVAENYLRRNKWNEKCHIKNYPPFLDIRCIVFDTRIKNQCEEKTKLQSIWKPKQGFFRGEWKRNHGWLVETFWLGNTCYPATDWWKKIGRLRQREMMRIKLSSGPTRVTLCAFLALFATSSSVASHMSGPHTSWQVAASMNVSPWAMAHVATNERTWADL